MKSTSPVLARDTESGPLILVPVDFSKHQNTVVEQAKQLAMRLDGELVLLHCAPPPVLSIVAIEPIYVPSVVMEHFTIDHSAAVLRKMQELKDSIGNGGKVRTMIKNTDAVQGILGAAVELECSYIVMGSYGTGIGRFVLGSVTEAVTRAATCPVIVARNTDKHSEFRKVIVAVDFSAYSAPLVGLARTLCAPNAEIHLVHSWLPPHLDTAHLFGDTGHEGLVAVLGDGLEQHATELARFTGRLPVDARYHQEVITGRPAASILEYAEEQGADAIFVGAHDSTRLENFLGTVSDRIIRNAPTTVLMTERGLQS